MSSVGQFRFDVSAQGSGNGGTVTADFLGDVTLDTSGIVGTAGGAGGGATVRSNGNITV